MIAVASDHGGFDLKSYVVKYLSENTNYFSVVKYKHHYKTMLFFCQ